MNAVGKHGVWCSFILVAVASSWFGAPVAAIQLPAGFEESVYAQDIVDPRAFGFLPDGRLVVASGPGGVYVADGALTTPVGTIATDTAGERGLESGSQSRLPVHADQRTTRRRGRRSRRSPVAMDDPHRRLLAFRRR